MFITFEGIEGSGKTTQIQWVEEWFQKMELPFFSTREPGGTPVGRKIRSLLLDRTFSDIVPEAELLLYMADRLQHVKTVIQPKVLEGKTVLCDRFFDATLAYQGYARGLDMDYIQKLHGMTCPSIKPDLTLLFDLPPEVGLSRAWRQIRSGDRDDLKTRFEEEDLTFHGKVRKGYLALAENEPERFRIIDAEKSLEGVRDDLIVEIENLIKLRT